MPFTFESTSLPGLLLVTPKTFEDGRGFFMETFKRSEFAEAGISVDFVQDNHSRSARSVLRGLHYQDPPHAQAKLIRVPRGTIYDVVVDIRPDSPTCARWEAYELSEANRKMLFVPPGFAHGFLVLSDEAETEYKVSAEYRPEQERGIIWNDPMLGIAWPTSDPVVSPKDAALPLYQGHRTKKPPAGR